MENTETDNVIYDDTWRYRVAYYFKEAKPKWVSSCTTFWRCLLFLIPAYLVSTVIGALLFLVMLLVAHYPYYKWGHGLVEDFDPRPIPWWPKFRNRNIWPITVFAIVGIPLALLCKSS